MLIMILYGFLFVFALIGVSILLGRLVKVLVKALVKLAPIFVVIGILVLVAMAAGG